MIPKGVSFQFAFKMIETMMAYRDVETHSD